MALKTVIKVSKISNLSDARYCAGMGVQMMGFCLDKHLPSFIDDKKAQEIASWVVGVKIVGELSTDILVELGDYPLDMLEVDSPQLINSLTQSEQHRNAPMIYRLTVDNVETLAFCEEVFSNYYPYISYFLLESNLLTINTQVTDILCRLCASYPILIGFGIHKNNVLEVLETIQPTGIALKGGRETTAGILDFEELVEIIELLEIEE